MPEELCPVSPKLHHVSLAQHSDPSPLSILAISGRDFSLVFTLQSSLDSYFDKRTLLPGPLCLFLKSQNLFCATTARKLGPQNSVLYDSQVPSVQHLNKYLGWMRLSEISIMCFSFLVSCKVNTCLHVTRSHTPDGACVPNRYFCNRFSKEDQALIGQQIFWLVYLHHK